MKFDPDEARKLLLRGHSVGSIAKKMRMTAAELYAALANYGTPVREIKEARKEAMKLDLAAGKSVDDVATKYGASFGYVSNVRREQAAAEKS